MEFFTLKECAAMQLGTLNLIEDMEKAAKNERLPWTPQSRAEMMDILKNAKSAIRKLCLCTGMDAALPSVTDREIKDTFTKES